MYSLHFLVILLIIHRGRGQESTQDVKSPEICENDCHFYNTSITSSTIKNWPSLCTRVCGNLVFNADTDLTGDQLEPYFQKLRHLNGIIKVELSNLTTLSFLGNMQEFKCEKGELIIARNSELKNVSAIEKWYSMTPCIWHVVLNPKLNFKPHCDIPTSNFNVDLNVYGNFQNCGCRNLRAGPRSLLYFPKCTSIAGSANGGLKISQISDAHNVSVLTSVKKIEGVFEVYNTSLQNLSFLENLETISGNSLPYFNTFNIHDNLKMTRLELKSLKKLSPLNGGFLVNLRNNDPDFCLTTYEIQLFAKSMAYFSDFEARICSDTYRKDGEMVCYFTTLKDVDSNCQHIVGDIVINEKHEKEIEKLNNVIIIYGSFTVEDTKYLEDLTFLKNLEQVVGLKMDSGPIVQFLSNSVLANVTFPKMKRPPFQINHESVIEIDGNLEIIFNNLQECKLYEEQTQSRVKYNGEECDALEELSVPSQSSPTESFDYVESSTIENFEEESEITSGAMEDEMSTGTSLIAITHSSVEPTTKSGKGAQILIVLIILVSIISQFLVFDNFL